MGPGSAANQGGNAASASVLGDGVAAAASAKPSVIDVIDRVSASVLGDAVAAAASAKLSVTVLHCMQHWLHLHVDLLLGCIPIRTP
jgi:hypothetical protein